MDNLIQKLFDMGATAEALASSIAQESNKSVDEFNEIFDQLEKANEELAILKANAEKDWVLLQKQETVIHAAVEVKKTDVAELNTVRAQLKELQRLDPKRLAKQNKGYKKTIDDLKERLANSETARKTAIKNAKSVRGTAKTEGNAAFHFDPTTKNAIRIVPTLHVSKTNAFGGVPGVPVIEFLHHNSGITRQGTLLTDGSIGWASAKNTNPSISESRIAREFLYDWCKSNKIKFQEAA